MGLRIYAIRTRFETISTSGHGTLTDLQPLVGFRITDHSIFYIPGTNNRANCTPKKYTILISVTKKICLPEGSGLKN